MAHTIQDIIRLFENFEKNWERHNEDWPYELKTSIVRQIARQGHIDTTAMIRSVNYHREAVTNSGFRFRIDTSDDLVREVTYDGFVEFPRKGWSGGFFYQRGIENADFERIADEIANDSFVI